MAPTLPMLGLDELTAFQNQAAANNPLLSIAPAVGQARFDMRTWDPMAQLGTSFAQSFLSGALGAIGRNQVADQVRAVAPLLPQLYNDPGSVAMPEGSDPAAFETLKNAAALRKLQRQTLMDQLRQDLALDLFKEQQKADMGAEAAGREAFNRLMGENQAWAAMSGGRSAADNPNSPAYRANMDQMKALDDLRKEVSNRKEFASFNEVANRFNVLKRAFTDPSRISDQDFVVGVAKILDPTSVVRETEGKAVIDSQSIPSSILGQLNAAVGGGAALDITNRVALLELAGRHYDQLKSVTDAIRDQYAGIAAERRLNADQILPPQIPGVGVMSKQDAVELVRRFRPTPEGKAAAQRALRLMGYNG